MEYKIFAQRKDGKKAKKKEEAPKTRASSFFFMDEFIQDLTCFLRDNRLGSKTADLIS